MCSFCCDVLNINVIYLLKDFLHVVLCCFLVDMSYFVVVVLATMLIVVLGTPFLVGLLASIAILIQVFFYDL